MELFFFYAKGVMFVALALSIVYTAGVVWRVEMKLDASYKFFLAGIICLFCAEAVETFAPVVGKTASYIVAASRMLFSLCFLMGILLMRDITRTMDGEK